MKINYVKTKIIPVISVSALYTVHYFNYGKKFRFDGESHDFWEIIFIDRGCVTITADDRIIELNQGEAYFHKPNEFHTVEANGFATSIIVSFAMTGDCAFFENKKIKLTKAQQMMLGNIVIEYSQAFNGPLADMFQTKMELKEDAPIGATQLIKCYLESLLITLMRKPSSLPTKKADSDAELTLQIKRYLSENLYGSISLDELSKALYFSKTYLSSKFRLDTGSSIIAYFNNMKIDEAKRLISSGRYSLTQIATVMGYGSSQYFTRIFKKATGFTPSEWAKSTKLDNILR